MKTPSHDTPTCVGKLLVGELWLHLEYPVFGQERFYVIFMQLLNVLDS